MWRNDDLYVGLWQLTRPGTEPPDPIDAVRAGKRSGHAAAREPAHARHRALCVALATLAGGGTVVLIDRPGLDAELVWDEIERNGVEALSIVGDVFARPLLAALDATPTGWDLGRLPGDHSRRASRGARRPRPGCCATSRASRCSTRSARPRG